MVALPAFEPELFMTEAEYLAFEDAAETKHEFVDGYVYDWPGYDFDAQGLAGATIGHGRLQMKIAFALMAAAAGTGCEVFGSDLRLRIRFPHTRRYYYPDVMVLCNYEPREDEGDDDMHVTRPCIVVEIVSRRSARIDHTEKLQAYLAMPSVQAYLIVHQQLPRVECYARGPDGIWPTPTVLNADDSVKLPCVNANLSVAALYA